jgi:hypothetical protein
MAHFAQIDSDNIVTQVIVVDNSDAPNEAAGISFCKDVLGSDTNWVQTSYNNNIRHRYAGRGMEYDAANDVFRGVQPYSSWTLNNSTWTWEAPVALPSDAGVGDEDNPTVYVKYDWDEDTTSWTNRTVVDF